jgi:hypothetical protein
MKFGFVGKRLGLIAIIYLCLYWKQLRYSNFPFTVI